MELDLEEQTEQIKLIKGQVAQMELDQEEQKERIKLIKSQVETEEGRAKAEEERSKAEQERIKFFKKAAFALEEQPYLEIRSLTQGVIKIQ